MRRVAALALGLWATAASAAMAPEVYETARTEAPDVVVIAIAGATPPPTGDYGDCEVTGTVLIVERGSRYRVGDPISLTVACARRDADYPDGGPIYEELTSLLASTYGRAFLAADGTLALWQYEQLTEAELP